MHATLSIRSIPRTLRSGFRSLVRSRTSTGVRRVKEDEEFCIVESTLEDASNTQSSNSASSLPLNPGTAPSTPYLLLRDSPLAGLELALLCTAQCIALQPKESQAAVLAVTATKATVVQISEPITAEAQVAIIDFDANAHSPSISVTLPRLKKTLPEADSKSIAPLLPLQNVTSTRTLRPSGNWVRKKRVFHKQSENVAPAPRHTQEELAKEHTQRVYPSRPSLRRRDAFNANNMRDSLRRTTPQIF